MQSIYEQYQLKNVINASGRMTMLGVSTPKAEVTERVGYGLNHYFEIKDLVNKTGQYIAKLLKVENAVVVSCASAGIAQSVAAVIVKDNADLLYNLHTLPQPVAREIVMPKGHNVNFGAPIDTMVALGGGEIVEAGYANECSAAQFAAKITDQTAAILYVKSHHCVQKSMLTVKEEAAQVAKKHQIPLIVDAAAEEDLVTYYQDGADLVIYSGAKAIEGPTSGLVIGKHQHVEWVKQQSSGIGRAMKVGKEGILGLTLAIELYLTDKKETGEQMVERMSDFIDDLNKIKGVKAQIVWDTPGRDIARAEISFDQKAIGKTTYAMMAELKQGDTAIYFREYKASEGKVEADIRSVTNEQLKTIVSRIRQVVTGLK